MANKSYRLPQSKSGVAVSGPTTAQDEIKAALDGPRVSAEKRFAKTAQEPAVSERTRKSWASARGWIGQELTKPTNQKSHRDHL